VGCFTRLRSKSTDLFVEVTCSEVTTNATPIFIRTNLDVVARLQVPNGNGVVLLKSLPGESDEGVFAALIDPPQSAQ
jgi:hypothetical protein